MMEHSATAGDGGWGPGKHADVLDERMTSKSRAQGARHVRPFARARAQNCSRRQ